MIRPPHVLLALLGLLLVLAGCPVTPAPVTPAPAGTGGVAVTGGASSGGETLTGGQPGAAGQGSEVASAGKTVCPAFVEPSCSASSVALSPQRKAELRRQLTGWRPSPDRAKARRWRPTYTLLPVCDVFWDPNNKRPFAQRRGSCTANAAGGILSTAPFSGRLTQDDVDERIYPLATRLDPFRGEWPPTDTGSNGSSAWRAAMQLGYTSIPSTPIDSLEELQGAMQRVTCMVGVDWYDSMFSPTKCGELTIGGPIAGGHEAHIIGLNLRERKVWIRNSWDIDWGLSRGDEIGGYAYMSFGTLQKLLNAGGEIDCPSHPPANDNAVPMREAG